jgi:cytochrome c peroxidase
VVPTTQPGDLWGPSEELLFFNGLLEETPRMSLAAERGRELFFNKAKCATGHVGQGLADELFHNIGIAMGAEEPDLGRSVVTGDEKDQGAFRTPSLRNTAASAPYRHDGGLATLYEVVVHYGRGGLANPWLSEKIFPLGLTEQERQDLVLFMEEALTGSVTEVGVPLLP